MDTKDMQKIERTWRNEGQKPAYDLACHYTCLYDMQDAFIMTGLFTRSSLLKRLQKDNDPQAVRIVRTYNNYIWNADNGVSSPRPATLGEFMEAVDHVDNMDDFENADE